ncbi:hypothetical protein GMRT_14144 [Giardia muris]|uniref:Uncharacterized protein n=1 Tax=Giardia muris TaxID=5742 RepID=A0A4Z1T228_GIAMU|nr:hypothetical protein GMRT_14144 [Giardia muris]|eukprot:TNJ27067.1 hypothetical protein GMRT_14144 [Giardia muris]
MGRMVDLTEMVERGEAEAVLHELYPMLDDPQALASLLQLTTLDDTGYSRIGELLSLLSAMVIIIGASFLELLQNLLENTYQRLLQTECRKPPMGPSECLRQYIILVMYSFLDNATSRNAGEDGFESKGQAELLHTYLSLENPNDDIWADFVFIPLILTGHRERAQALERQRPRLPLLPEGKLRDLILTLYPL